MRLPLFILSLFLILNLSAQDFALKQLEHSPRHHEWVNIKAGERHIKTFLVYPETAKKVPVVLVIHENRGLTDWVRSFADQLAQKGYIALAPDLLSGYSENMGSTAEFESSDAARNAIYTLDPKQIEKDLNAVQAYAEKIPSGNGKTAVMGFCWGGSQAFRMTTYNHRIDAALVFYGSAPQTLDEVKRISVPVYGFYGGNDNRINAGIPQTEELMHTADKTYTYKIYEGAGHGYMRQGDDPEGLDENIRARNESWDRILSILNSL